MAFMITLASASDISALSVRGSGGLCSRCFAIKAYTDAASNGTRAVRSEEHTSELQSQSNLVCRLLLEKKNVGGPDAGRRAVLEYAVGLRQRGRARATINRRLATL